MSSAQRPAQREFVFRSAGRHLQCRRTDLHTDQCDRWGDMRLLAISSRFARLISRPTLKPGQRDDT
jgi:hypothetical protein